MTDTTNTSAAHAAALAMRDAAAALARRLPLYYGSGEPADEDLAQAIEDLPLPDVDVTDWKAEAERLRAEVARLSPTDDEIRYTADQDWTGLSGATAWHLAERHGEGWAGIGEMMEAWRDAEVQRITAGLTAERDAARAELERARGVLQNMEWDSWGYDRFGEGRAHCPCCGCTKDEGHAPDCELNAALAAKGE